MTWLIALEDFSTRICSANFKSYLVAVFLGQNVMEQSCRLLSTGLLTVKTGQITKLYYFSKGKLSIKISYPPNVRERRRACSSCGQKLATIQHALGLTSPSIHFTSIFSPSRVSPSNRNISGEEFSLFCKFYFYSDYYGKFQDYTENKSHILGSWLEVVKGTLYRYVDL